MVKIACTSCKTGYRISEEKLPKRKAITTCKKCGARIIVDPARLLQPSPASQAVKPSKQKKPHQRPVRQPAGQVQKPASHAVKPATPPEQPAAAREIKKPVTSRPDNQLVDYAPIHRRAAAFALDALPLCAIAYLTAFFLLYRSPEAGFGVGFLIAMIYFGVFHSAIGRGQTPGMRLMQIKLQDRFGSRISLFRSILRFFVFFVPFMLIAMLPPPGLLTPLTVFALSVLAVGAAGALIYLAFFNRQTRQSLHDLAAGTYVVLSAHRGPISAKPVWKGHALALVAWLAVSTAALHWALPLWYSLHDQTPSGKMQAVSRHPKPPAVSAQSQPPPSPVPGSADSRLSLEENLALRQLMTAVMRGDLSKVRQVLETGDVDVNARVGNGGTALMRSVLARRWNRAVFTTLLQHGADVNQQDKYGYNALIYASMRDNMQAIRLLIDNGADINLKDAEGCTLLHHACKRGSSELVKLLLQMNAPIGGEDNSGLTPLQHAVKSKSVDLVERLIENGANVHTVAEDGQNLVSWAVTYGNYNLFKLLLDKGAPLPIEGPAAGHVLTIAGKNRDMKLLKMAVSKGIDVNMPDSNGWTPLTAAALGGELTAVTILLSRGADVHATDSHGYSALSRACENCNAQDIVRFLLDKGTDVNRASRSGATPLMQTVNYNCTDIAKILIERGADVNRRDINGSTALMSAVRKGNAEFVNILQAAGADVNIKDAEGDTALTYAKSQEFRKMLVKAGAVENLANDDQMHLEMVHALPYDKRLAEGLKTAIELYGRVVSPPSEKPVQAALSAKQVDRHRYQITCSVSLAGKTENLEFELSNQSRDIRRNLATIENVLAKFAAQRKQGKKKRSPARSNRQKLNAEISENLSHFDCTELFQTIDLVDRKIASGELGLAGLHHVAEIYAWLSFFKNANRNRDLSDMLATQAVGNFLLAGLDRAKEYDRDFCKGLLLLALDYPAAAESVLAPDNQDAAALAAYIRGDTAGLKAMYSNLHGNRRLCGYLLARAYQATEQYNLSDQQFRKLVTDYPDFLLAKEFAADHGGVGISRHLMQSYIVEMLEKHLHLVNRFYHTDWISSDLRLRQEIRNEVPVTERLKKWLAIHSRIVNHSNQLKRRSAVLPGPFLGEYMSQDIRNALMINYRLEADKLGRLSEASVLVELAKTIYPDSTLAMNFEVRQTRDGGMLWQLLSDVNVEKADRPLLTTIFYKAGWSRTKKLDLVRAYRRRENPDTKGSLQLFAYYDRLFHHTTARQCLENALAANPYNPDIYEQLLKNGNASKYIAIGKKRAGNHYGFLVALADRHMREKDMRKAESLYKRAIEVSPAQYGVYKKLGNLYVQEGKHELAVKTWQRYFVHDDSSLSAVVLKRAIGNLYIDNGDYEKAYEVYLDAQKSFQADALLGFARASELTGRILQAEEVYRKAAERYPQGYCPVDLGLFYIRQSNLEMAYKTFRGYKRYQSAPYYYYEHLIKHFAESGQPEKAVEIVKQVEKRNGQDWGLCLRTLYKLYASSGHYDIAARLAQEANAQTRNNIDLAGFYELSIKGKLPGHDRVATDVARRHDAVDIYHIGRWLCETGLYDEATRVFLALLKKGSGPRLSRLKWSPEEGLADAAVAWCLSARDVSLKKEILNILQQVEGDPWTNARVRFLLGDIDDKALARHASGKEKQFEFHYCRGVVELADGRKEEALKCFLMCLDMQAPDRKRGYYHVYQLAESIKL